MVLRKAIEEDIPEIVKVLKASLGETDLPLSEQIWNFKHVENPFGRSLVLVAVEDDNIVGVRAFMRWQWQKKGKTFSSFRAVDTATHPEHQGKGIFKKLTLKAVELAKEEGDHLIFNTPNDKSRPGYLKMGWQQAGKLRVGLKPALNSFWKLNSGKPEYNVRNKVSPDLLKELCESWNSGFKEKSHLFTPKSSGFLEWRYEKNPLQEYEVLATADFYLAVYVKKRKNIKELRISESIYRGNKGLKSMQRAIKEFASKFGVQVISFSPQVVNFPIALKGNFGPILTIRELNLDLSEKIDFLETENWAYCLGDLELF